MPHAYTTTPQINWASDQPGDAKLVVSPPCLYVASGRSFVMTLRGTSCIARPTALVRDDVRGVPAAAPKCSLDLRKEVVRRDAQTQQRQPQHG